LAVQQEQSCYKTQGDNNMNIVIYCRVKKFIKQRQKQRTSFTF